VLFSPFSDPIVTTTIAVALPSIIPSPAAGPSSMQNQNGALLQHLSQRQDIAMAIMGRQFAPPPSQQQQQQPHPTSTNSTTTNPPQQQQQPTAEKRCYLPTWQREDDMPHRREIILQMYVLLFFVRFCFIQLV
jgi:hypothetical protein